LHSVIHQVRSTETERRAQVVSLDAPKTAEKDRSENPAREKLRQKDSAANRQPVISGNHLANELHLSLTPRGSALLLVSLLCTRLPFLARRAIRLVYSMPYSERPNQGMHRLLNLIHPISVFFNLWTLTTPPAVSESNPAISPAESKPGKVSHCEPFETFIEADLDGD
jgi:hypothetical protein